MSALLLFLGYLAFALWRMAPCVTFGDAGELIAAAATLSIPHAPGYPLFCLLGKVAGELVPLGNWAYRVNLLCALCASGAVSLFWSGARRAGLPGPAALTGTLCLALSPLWLDAALQTEVFALNALAACAALFCITAFPERPMGGRGTALMGLCLGLGGANHHTLILAAPALLWEAYRGAAPRVLARRLLLLALFGLLALALYAYLPLRAAKSPPLDWGHATTPASFLRVLLRKDYGSFALSVEGSSGGGWAGLPSQVLRYARALWAHQGAWTALLALFGIWAWRREGGIGLHWAFPLLWIVCAGPLFLCLGRPPFDAQTSATLERFYVLPSIGVALLYARAAAFLGRRWRAAPWLLLVPSLVLAARTFPSWDRRGDFAASDYGRNVLRSLPKGAVFFMDGGDDTFYTLAFWQYAQGLRGDVAAHDRGGLVFKNPYGADFRSLPRAEKEARRVSVESSAALGGRLWYSTLQDKILPGHGLLSWGLLRKAEPRPGPEEWASQAELPQGRALWELYPLRLSRDLSLSSYRYRALSAVYAVSRSRAESARGESERALAWLGVALRQAFDVTWVREEGPRAAQWIAYLVSRRGDWRRAEEAYAIALELKPEDPDILLNLGVSEEKQGRPEAARAFYERVLKAVPDSFQAHYNLGSLYWSAKDWARSAESFAAALRAREDPAARKFHAEASRRAGARP